MVSCCVVAPNTQEFHELFVQVVPELRASVARQQLGITHPQKYLIIRWVNNKYQFDRFVFHILQRHYNSWGFLVGHWYSLHPLSEIVTQGQDVPVAGIRGWWDWADEINPNMMPVIVDWNGMKLCWHCTQLSIYPLAYITSSDLLHVSVILHIIIINN